MEIFQSWFGSQMSFTLMLQIILDVGLIILLFLLLGRRSRPLDGAEELIQTLEKILEETTAITTEFDANLHERKMLLQNILAKLDDRLNEAEKVCKRLEGAQSVAVVNNPAPLAPPKGNDHDKVFKLPNKGLAAEAIAKRLQKPLGEVELILNLKKMYSSR
jgi:hypothetical protein